MNFSDITDITQLIYELDNLSTNDLNYEWDCLVENYSKLKYLENIDYELIGSTKLMDSLRRFMEQIDKVSQHYLREILWEESLLEIEKYLSYSLNHNNPITKLKYVIKAYELLVPVVEKIREQKCVQQIEDHEFIQTFSIINPNGSRNTWNNKRRFY
jgi:hypothetical protein